MHNCFEDRKTLDISNMSQFILGCCATVRSKIHLIWQCNELPESSVILVQICLCSKMSHKFLRLQGAEMRGWSSRSDEGSSLPEKGSEVFYQMTSTIHRLRNTQRLCAPEKSEEFE